MNAKNLYFYGNYNRFIKGFILILLLLILFLFMATDYTYYTYDTYDGVYFVFSTTTLQRHSHGSISRGELSASRNHASNVAYAIGLHGCTRPTPSSLLLFSLKCCQAIVP